MAFTVTLAGLILLLDIVTIGPQVVAHFHALIHGAAAAQPAQPPINPHSFNEFYHSVQGDLM